MIVEWSLFAQCFLEIGGPERRLSVEEHELFGEEGDQVMFHTESKPPYSERNGKGMGAINTMCVIEEGRLPVGIGILCQCEFRFGAMVQLEFVMPVDCSAWRGSYSRRLCATG